MTDNSAADPVRMDPERTEEFLALYSEHQRGLMLYIASLLPRSEDVDDVVQETCSVLWREFDSFQRGTNFRAWACTVAFNQVRAWRKKQQRDRLVFSDQFLNAISDELINNSPYYEQRSAKTQDCIRKLPLHHRELVRLRYHVGRSIDELATRFDRSTDAVYRMLSRIRQVLHECVTRSVRAGESND